MQIGEIKGDNQRKWNKGSILVEGGNAKARCFVQLGTAARRQKKKEIEKCEKRQTGRVNGKRQRETERVFFVLEAS